MNLSSKKHLNFWHSSINQNVKVKALLGPTNTGKTYYAMERMLSHSSGIIGFPLRLLARENYDKAVSEVGKSKVALVTGEEKIIPPNAQYFCCTVESMPSDRSFSFVIKTPPVSYLIKKAANIKKGSKTTPIVKVGKISKNQVEEIAKTKMVDLNANDISSAMKIVEGTAKSMGVEVEV